MKQLQTTIWRVLLAAAAIVGQAGLANADVTVVGTAGLPADYSPAVHRWNYNASPNAAAPATANPRYGQDFADPNQSEPNEPNLSGPEGGPVAGTPRVVNFESPCESNWYTRADYFHWGSHDIDKTNTRTEDGALYTLGYARRVGPERFRLEFFGGDMEYSQRGPETYEANSDASYLGVRGEGEYLWPMEMIGVPALEFKIGVGTMGWIKDVKDTIAFDGTSLMGFQQTWWTIYPYIGLEKKWMHENCWETFVTGRIGCTVFTYEHRSTLDWPAFYPRLGVTGQLEAGVRRNALSVSAYLDALTWDRSDPVHSSADDAFHYIGASQMVTIGVKLGLTY